MYDYVIDLDTVLKHYRTESSSKGDNWRNDVFYVYFSIPNEFLQKYDNLAAVEYKYWEEMFNGFACSDDEVYKYAKQLMLYDGTFSNDGTVYVTYLPTLVSNYGYTANFDVCDFLLNFEDFSGMIFGGYLTELSNVVQVEDWTEDGILFFDFNLENGLSYAQDGCTYGLNRVTTTTYEILEVKSLFGNESDLKKWFLNNLKGYSDEVVNDVDVSNSCIEKIDETFFNGFENASSWSQKHFIEVKDMNGVRSFYNEAMANDRTMYIMRLPKTRDYYSAKSSLFTDGFNDNHFWERKYNGFYFQGTSITDFNIISFTFQDEGISYKVLVNDDVQDFEVPIEGPIDTDFDNFNESISKWWENFTNSEKGVWEGVKEVLQLVAMIIILVLMVIALYYVIKLIFKIKAKKQKSKKTETLVYSSSSIGKFRHKNKDKDKNKKKYIKQENSKEKIENKNEVDKVIIIN